MFFTMSPCRADRMSMSWLVNIRNTKRSFRREYADHQNAAHTIAVSHNTDSC